MALDRSSTLTLATSFVTWVVQLLSGTVTARLHNLADKHPDTWYGKLFRAHDAAPPHPPQQNDDPLNLSPGNRELMRTMVTKAVKEGNKPLVTAIEALQATIAADTAQHELDDTSVRSTPSPPFVHHDPHSILDPVQHSRVFKRKVGADIVSVQHQEEGHLNSATQALLSKLWA
ncbi:MAG: hypothetical protein Q9212_006579 [Teloschistes hypoglaucus]